MALCTDCDARSEYISNGGSDYNITFEYDCKKPYLINVAVRNPETTEYIDVTTEDLNYPWSIVSPDGVTSTQVRFETAPPVGYEVVIYRCTDVDSELAHFQPGHPIKASDLENNFSILGDAIEENCDGLEWLHGHIDNNYWDKLEDTIGCSDEWISNDNLLATTCAIDARFWDQVDETLYSGDEFKNSDNYILSAAAIEKRFWNSVKDDDSTYTTSNWLQHVTCPNDYVPTTGAVEQRLQDFYTKDSFYDSIVTGVDQRTGQWNNYNTDDNHVPTTDAVVERHDTHYSDEALFLAIAPLMRHGDHGGGNNEVYPEPDKENQRGYIQPGKFWVNTQTQRLAYWNDQGYWVHTGAMPANAQPPVYVNNEEPTGQIDEGDLWYNTGDGLMYVYYCPDPSGSCQWVSIGGSGGGNGGPGGGYAIETEAPLEHTNDIVQEKTTVKFRINSLAYLR